MKFRVLIPYNTEKTTNVNISVPLADLGFGGYNSFTVTDAENGTVIASETASDVEKLTVSVNKKEQKVLIITDE